MEPWASAAWEQDRDWELHTAEHDDPDALRALYQDAGARSRSAITTTDLDTLSIGRDRDGRQWSLQWILSTVVILPTRRSLTGKESTEPWAVPLA